MLCFECEMSPSGSSVWTLGIQRVALFGEVVVSLRDSIFLSGWELWTSLEVSEPGLLHVCSLLTMCALCFLTPCYHLLLALLPVCFVCPVTICFFVTAWPPWWLYPFLRHKAKWALPSLTCCCHSNDESNEYILWKGKFEQRHKKNITWRLVLCCH